MAIRRKHGNGEMMEVAQAHVPYDPREPAKVEDTGRYTKTTITVQMVGEEEIPVTYEQLAVMISQQYPANVKVRIEQRELRIRRVEFGPKYL